MAQVEFDVVANDKATGAINSIAVAAGNILSSLAQTAATAVFDFAKGSISAASDLNETLSKTNVIFGETSAEMIAWSKNAAETVGLSGQAALDSAAMFATFGKAAGLAGSELNTFATENVQLAADLASFFNTTVEDASVALQAAFRGETEPIRRYGIMLDDATMRAKAFELGIISTTKNALTPQQKVLAAQALIMDQTSDAQGDFARTADGLANSQRILTAQLENVQTELGVLFLPIVTDVVGFLSREGVPALRDFIDSFKTLANNLAAGREPLNQIGLFMQQLGVPLDMIANGMTNLRVISQQLQPGIESFKAGFQTLVPILQIVASEFMNTITPVLQHLAATVVPFFVDSFNKIGQWFEDNSALIGEFAGVISEMAAGVIAAVSFLIEQALPLLGFLGESLGQIAVIIMEFFTGDEAGLIAAIEKFGAGIGTAVMNLIDSLVKALGGESWSKVMKVWASNFDKLLLIAGTLKTKIADFAANVINGLLEGFKNNWDSIITWFETSFGDLIEMIKDMFGIQSPSKVMAGIGKNISRGLAVGIEQGMGAVQGAMVSGLAGMTTPALAYSGAGSYAMSNYGNINVHLNGGDQQSAQNFLDQLGVMMGAG